jgi:hypothetical protein
MCNVCGSGGELLVHHIDGDRDNNELENLLPVCSSCHGKIHAKNSKGVKWDRFTEKLPDSALLKGPLSKSGFLEWEEGESVSWEPTESDEKEGYTIDDPELVEKLQVDKEGRLYLGKDFANDNVRVCVERIND